MRGRALCLLRPDITYRRDAFSAGLAAVGYEITTKQFVRPTCDDVVLIWNRYGDYDVIARQFEAVGATVLVTENGYLGKSWLGGQWFALSIGHHAGAGRWVEGSASRWASWGVELSDWHEKGERIILAQRGIGEPGIAAPVDWAQSVHKRLGGRIRPHPGKRQSSVTLEDDLKNAGEVVTWSSAAALQALVCGVPVRCAFDRWIGRSACSGMDGPLRRDDGARLKMFERLAWAMWTLDELKSGEPFSRLLCE